MNIKKFCKFCSKNLNKYYFKKHKLTKKHKKNEKEFNQMKNEIILPQELLNIILGYKNSMEENIELIEVANSINNGVYNKQKKKARGKYIREISFVKRYNRSLIQNIFDINIDTNISYIWFNNRKIKHITISFNPIEKLLTVYN
jgi:hypothetical protein